MLMFTLGSEFEFLTKKLAPYKKLIRPEDLLIVAERRFKSAV